MLRDRPIRLLATLSIFAAASAVSHAGQEISAPYGKRSAPVGDGGDITVKAPTEWCSDSTHELHVRRYLPPGNEMLYAARGPAGPSNCDWHFDALTEGTYDAVIVRRDNGHIVGTSPKAHLVRGGTTVIRLEPASLEIEGRVTLNGLAPRDAQLVFTPNNAFNRWKVPLNEDGTYRVQLDGGEVGAVCMRLERARTDTIGTVAVGCERFDPGLRRYDADLRIPVGVIRVEVVPAQPGVKQDWTSLIVVVEAAGKQASSSGFKVTSGYRGEQFGVAFGRYDVSVQTVPHHRVLTQSQVTVSPDKAFSQVRLVVPTESLTCNEGWWSAC